MLKYTLHISNLTIHNKHVTQIFSVALSLHLETPKNCWLIDTRQSGQRRHFPDTCFPEIMYTVNVWKSEKM